MSNSHLVHRVRFILVSILKAVWRWGLAPERLGLPAEGGWCLPPVAAERTVIDMRNFLLSFTLLFHICTGAADPDDGPATGSSEIGVTIGLAPRRRKREPENNEAPPKRGQ